MTDDLYYRKMESTSTIELVDVIRKNDEHIEQLEQENEKLRKNADKAKDHIKKLLGCLRQDTNDPETNYYVCKYMTEAEQFLKECE